MWGTSYTFEGYISRVRKDELESELKELKDHNDILWAELLAYAASTPPATAEDCEGERYPWQEFIATRMLKLRQDIEENMTQIVHIEDCLETIAESPDKVSDD